MFASFMQGQNVVACGSAGTGKTYVATYLALQEVFAQRKNKIVFVRSAVPTRQIGHLPEQGTTTTEQGVSTDIVNNNKNIQNNGKKDTRTTVQEQGSGEKMLGNEQHYRDWETDRKSVV